MFARVKRTSNSPRKSVQIVHSERLGSKVKQKIIRHVGIAMDDKELEELKLLANAIKVELESKKQTSSLYSIRDRILNKKSQREESMMSMENSMMNFNLKLFYQIQLPMMLKRA